MKESLKLLIIIALFWFAQYVYVPYTTPYLLAQKVGADFVGLVVGIYGGVQMFVRLPIGVVADLKANHKYFIVAALLFSCFASIIRCFFPNGIGFFIANFCSGLGSALWICFIIYYTQCLLATPLQKAMGYLFASSNFGIAFSFLCATIFYQRMGMVFICLLSVLSTIPALLLALTLKGNKSTKTKDEQEVVALSKKVKDNKDQLSDYDKEFLSYKNLNIYGKIKRLLKVCINKDLNFYAFMAWIQQGVLMGTIMSFTTEQAYRIGASDVHVGIISMMYIFSVSCSSYLSSCNFIIKIGPKNCIIYLFMILGIYCILNTLITNIYIFIFIQILAGLASGVIFTWCNSQSLRSAKPYNRSTAIGYFQSFFGMGMTIVPIFAGICITLFDSFLSAFYMQALLSFLASFIAYLWFKKQDNCTVI